LKGKHSAAASSIQTVTVTAIEQYNNLHIIISIEIKA